jgi:hypothetical protein
MNTEMVRATLDGSKTQTRRIMRPQPEIDGAWYVLPKYRASSETAFREGAPFFGNCPYGKAWEGDRLWVRESARVLSVRGGIREIDIEYQADKSIDTVPYPSRLAPAPLGKLLSNGTYREASRILLGVTDVRVERLQNISRADAITEGIQRSHDGMMWRDYLSNSHAQINPIDSYRTLWESINGPGSWDANPWVWVIEFPSIRP